MSSASQRWQQWFKAFWSLFFLVSFGLFVARGLLFFSYRPTSLPIELPDLGASLWLGLRFDLKHLSVLLGPWLLISLFFYKASNSFWQVFRFTFWIYSACLLLAINLLSIINHYFFAFYQSPINSLFFGLQEDDTQAVLTTVWSDFPVAPLLFLLFGWTAAQIFIALKIEKRPVQPFIQWRLWITASLSIILLVGLGRGSLGTFPLRTQHINVSKYSFFNQLVPSGAHALYLAHKERRQDRIGTDPSVALKLAGYSNWQSAAQACGLDTDASEPTEGELFTLLPNHPAAAELPPHVVFALMESWGSHLLQYDDPQRTDLLGSLRPWLYEKGEYFPHALASQNGTYPSLEALLLDTPITPLMQTNHGYKTYNTSRILPYKKQGYKTVFLTAGPRAWRRLDPTLLRQGFDEIHDAVSIKEKFPQAETHTWGVDDEWMFLYAQSLLEKAEKNGEKLFLFMLSVTNHPPHRVPSTYTPLPLNLESIQKDAVSDESTTRKVLETYQYANNALGIFLNHLQDSNLLDKTIITATGDHPNRTVFNYSDSSELYYKYGVPVWFYIPKDYQGAHHDNISRQQWTSHQDIFPTLWAHSLSATIVPSSAGRNLFDPIEGAIPLALTFNGRGLSVSSVGAVMNPIQPNFLQWHHGQLYPTDTPNEILLAQAERTKACIALSDWRIRTQALR